MRGHPPSRESPHRFNCAAPFRERLGRNPWPRSSRCRRFNCAAPFRERLERGQGNDWARGTGFNCAAPFRERLGGMMWPASTPSWTLQLCRPLSGAVSYDDHRSRRRHGLASTPSWTLQLCRPLSGAVSSGLHADYPVDTGFNCAAPFRERLAPGGCLRERCHRKLQLCRPLSGAVSSIRMTDFAMASHASIVPPPFGSGYGRGGVESAFALNASIVPPPFGSG